MDTRPDRLFFLDWLRIAAFGVLILYHVGMYYVSWDWHVKSPYAGPALEPFMRLSSPWRLALLFLVSGAATSFMLARGRAGFVAGRSKRLLLPLLFGMAVVVPPQPYFEVVHKAGYAGSYWDFLGLYFSAYGGFCRGGQCLVLPTWNHLWFVAYLWVYTMVLWALLRWRPPMLDALAGHARRALAGWRVLVLPIAVLALVRIALVGRFPSTHALFGDWFNHALYLPLFIAGAVFARMPSVWREFESKRWAALGIALAGWALLVVYYDQFSHTTPPDALRQAQRVTYAAVQWCAIVAALGFAHRYCNADHAWRRYLTDAVFPVYLLHQTLIVLLSQALRPLDWTPALEGPVLVAATFVLSFAGYEWARRIAPLRPWIGLPSTPCGAAATRIAASSG